jgi:uncharacterized protein YcnI
MNNIPRRAVCALIAVAALAVPATALGHASVSPPTVIKQQNQFFTIAVPGEEENDTTVKVQVDFPSGFGVDSFQAVPGWTRTVKSSGSGEEAEIQSATWTGGSVPTGEDAVFGFVAEPQSSGDYTFKVTQTYASGKVVEWTGAESSDTPAAVVHVLDQAGGGSSSNTLAIIALVLGGSGLVIGLIAALLVSRRSLT